jgi:hypothetical protein
MKRSQAYPSQYLSQEDVRAAPIRATIEDVRIETIGRSDDADEKPVVHFREKNLKNFALNLTNWTTIEAAYGPESDAWKGRVIELYLDPGIKFGRETVGGVRIRIPSDAAPATRLEPAEAIPWPQALKLAAEVGMDEAALKAALKTRGLTEYNPRRDAGAVRDVLSKAAEAKAVEDTIPF